MKELTLGPLLISCLHITNAYVPLFPTRAYYGEMEN